MTQGTVQEQIMVRALKDETFRQELLSNPRAVLAKEYNVQIPESVSIRVVEDTAETFTITLPPRQASMQELSDAELETVAGGLPPPFPFSGEPGWLCWWVADYTGKVCL